MSAGVLRSSTLSASRRWADYEKSFTDTHTYTHIHRYNVGYMGSFSKMRFLYFRRTNRTGSLNILRHRYMRLVIKLSCLLSPFLADTRRVCRPRQTRLKMRIRLITGKSDSIGVEEHVALCGTLETKVLERKRRIIVCIIEFVETSSRHDRV